jgi:hypothetical protein
MSPRSWHWLALLAALSIGIASASAEEKPVNSASAKRKKIVYRSHTQVDLSGETVQGKIRAPEVFYIFQRKRSEAHHVVETPLGFEYHQESIKAALGRSLPK